MSCRINKSRKWTGKLLLEMSTTPTDLAHFVTLTYDDEHVPKGNTLVKEHALQFRKALSKRLGYFPRYFMVGEYGNRSERPHYHAALFNLPSSKSDAIENAWGKGFTSISPMTPERAAYIAQYCTKKLTRPDDIRLGSRHPEFTQMSRRPALGDAMVASMGKELATRSGRKAVQQIGDVPHQFRTGGTFWPFTDRHKQILRMNAGLPKGRLDVEAINPHCISWEMTPLDLDERTRRITKEQQRATRKAIFTQKSASI